ncbi:MAG: YdcF family protein [Marinibacterium sp.]
MAIPSLARYLLRAAALVLLVWALTFAGLVATALLWPRAAPMPDPADAIVCLGGSMSYMGWERPGPASARRARTCAELYRAGIAPVIVFTGYGHERMSAAEAMAHLAEADGVPADAVILEPRARSTLQNAGFALPLLPEGASRIVLVSDAFHLPRSWMIFRALGAPRMALYAARRAYTTPDKPATRNEAEWILRESVVVWVNVGRLLVYGAGGILGIDRATRLSWFN